MSDPCIDLSKHCGSEPRHELSRRQILTSAVGVGAAGLLAAAVYEKRQPAGSSSVVPLPPPNSASGSPPPSAGLGGCDHLAFVDDFSDEATIGLASQPETKWYRELPFGWGDTATSDYTVQGSVLRLTPAVERANWTISTLASTGEGRSFGHGYFEARMRFPEPQLAARGIAWPAFWALSSSHVTGVNDEEWMEIDFFEAIDDHGSQRYHGTVHEWNADSSGSLQSHLSPAVVEAKFSEWNTFGCLWLPGHVSWYLNRSQLLAISYGADRLPSPSAPEMRQGTFSALDDPTHAMTVILGTGPGWLLDVDWVSIWTKP